MRFSRFVPLSLLALATPSTAANGKVYTDAVTYCSEARAVLVDEFSIAYYQANQSIFFTFSLAAVESNLNVSVNIYLNAYGINLVNDTLELCSYFEGVICPLPQVNFTGYGTYPIPSKYISSLPGIAYTVPNLEAYARVELIREGSGEIAACLQATLSNGKSTQHKSIAYCTAFFALLALLVGVFHTAAADSPSPAQYRWFDVLYLYQTAVATGLLHLNYPLAFSNFVNNFAWAFALFPSAKMQSSINKMRFKTGGHLDGTAYGDVQYINRKLSPYNNLIVLENTAASFNEHIARAESYSLFSRATIPSTVDQNATTALSTGLPVYVNTNGIPEANALTTTFLFFLAFCALTIVFHVLLYAVAYVFDRGGRRTLWATRLRQMWWQFCGGNALRLCLIWFLPLWILGFWQFFIGDSKLAIFFAALGLALTFIPLAIVFVLSVIKSRRLSSTAPSASPLYTSYRWFHSVGMLYRPYRQRFHLFWFAPLVLAMIARAGFISFGPDDAWAQVIGNIVVEGIVFILLLACRPHKDRKGDWLAPFLSFCRLAAFGLLIAFIPSMGVRPIPRTVIGIVEIALFGIPTVLLFLGLIWNAGYGYLWRKHTRRIEDGSELDRFYASDDDSQQTMQQADTIFVRGVDPSSVIEPVDKTYEPSTSTYQDPSIISSMPMAESSSNPTLATPVDRRYSATAYADAAEGRGQREELATPVYSEQWREQPSQ
ncbi:hypothetical protein BCR39DRAFT_463489 [Naematelia encephala]|uniref:ML-like domain-containing protein n=1 Tax=Naematelia encephala TaxID=71784 RepID=A0A1Y2BEX6_9TREE|nr:hypothetical protein BCR39DRAFT_463489 [Naematelia encephala]